MSARDEVLTAVRSALGPNPAVPQVPRAYSADAEGDAALFCERVADYRAAVHRCDESDLERTLAGLLDGKRVAVPSGLAWRPAGAELLVDDPPLSPAQLDATDAVLTGCAVAIAETGTVVLDGSPRCGRRALSLVPDHHVCVVEERQIVGGLPAAVEGISPTAPLTLISGPSATSDIELERVEGVHGPRRLDVVVVAVTSVGG